MKKVFSISLVMLMALCVFISCNPSSGVEDNVSVTLNAKNGEIELEKRISPGNILPSSQTD